MKKGENNLARTLPLAKSQYFSQLHTHNPSPVSQQAGGLRPSSFAEIADPVMIGLAAWPIVVD
jgi:hypothetical protein